MSNTMTEALAGYKAGVWDIDTAHSDVSFSVRHMMVSKVRGHFKNFSGKIETGDNPTKSLVSATIDLASIDTNNTQRDDHIRSADFFEVEKFPEMTFVSTSVVADGDDWKLIGDLNLHGVTKSISLELESNGFSPDPYGGYRSGFSAHGEINRKDFGITIDMPMDGGGVVVGDKIQIALEIEAVLRAGEKETAA